MKEAVWTTLKHLFGHLFHFLTKTKAGSILLKYGVALLLLAYVIFKNWDGLVEVFQRPIRVEPLLIATAIYCVGLIVSFLRWHYLVVAVGLPFTRYNAIRLGLVGFFFNTFLPGAIGGDVVKAYAIARESSRRTLAVTTVLVDRIIGLWALIWFVAILGSTFWLLGNPIIDNRVLKGIIVSTIIFCVVTLAIWVGLGFLPEGKATSVATKIDSGRGWRHSLAELWRACWMYRKQPRVVFLAILVTLVLHAGWVSVFHFAAHAFEPPNPETSIGTFPEHVVIVPVGMTVSAFIPLPGGIGVGEAAFGQLYEILGKPKVNGIVACMSQRVIFFSLAFVGYIVYLRMRTGIAVDEKSDEPPSPTAAQAGLVVEPEAVRE